MADVTHTTIPTDIALFAHPARGFRFHWIGDNANAPDIRSGDCILVAPVEKWEGDGYYLLEGLSGGFMLKKCVAPLIRNDGPVIDLLTETPRGQLRAAMDYDDFRARLIGKAAMICNITDPQLLPQN